VDEPHQFRRAREIRDKRSGWTIVDSVALKRLGATSWTFRASARAITDRSRLAANAGATSTCTAHSAGARIGTQQLHPGPQNTGRDGQGFLRQGCSSKTRRRQWYRGEKDGEGRAVHGPPRRRRRSSRQIDVAPPEYNNIWPPDPPAWLVDRISREQADNASILKDKAIANTGFLYEVAETRPFRRRIAPRRMQGGDLQNNRRSKSEDSFIDMLDAGSTRARRRRLSKSDRAVARRGPERAVERAGAGLSRDVACPLGRSYNYPETTSGATASQPSPARASSHRTERTSGSTEPQRGCGTNARRPRSVAPLGLLRPPKQYERQIRGRDVRSARRTRCAPEVFRRTHAGGRRTRQREKAESPPGTGEGHGRHEESLRMIDEGGHGPPGANAAAKTSQRRPAEQSKTGASRRKVLVIQHPFLGRVDSSPETPPVTSCLGARGRS